MTTQNGTPTQAKSKGYSPHVLAWLQETCAIIECAICAAKFSGRTFNSVSEWEIAIQSAHALEDEVLKALHKASLGWTGVLEHGASPPASSPDSTELAIAARQLLQALIEPLPHSVDVAATRLRKALGE